jgi:NF-X1-type zinc finger protein NFXL1
MECHCGKTDLTFPCSEHQQILKQQHLQRLAGGSSAVDALCCGKVCHKELPFCPHSCTALCHKGNCPEAKSCSEEVTVRCSCRRQKEKWACAKVQAALAAAGGSSGSNGSSKLYDGSEALKLLPCDGLCAAAAKEKQQQPPGSAAGAAASSSSRDASPTPRRSSSVKQAAQAKQEQAVVTATPAAPGAAPAAAGLGKSTKKLSRAERDALAAAKEAERLQQQRQQQMRQAGLIVAVVLVVLLVGFGLSFGLEQLVKALKAADATLQDKYAPNREL